MFLYYMQICTFVNRIRRKFTISYMITMLNRRKALDEILLSIYY